MSTEAAGPFQLAVTTRLDRRRAEVLVLELRRRLSEMGFAGARVSVAPAGPLIAASPAPPGSPSPHG